MKMEMKMNIQFFTKKRIVLLVAAFLAILLLFLAFDCRLLIRRYSIEAEEISSPIRAVLVTDLHSCKYGKNQSRLIRALTRQNPDMVLFSGDIFDDEIPDTNTELFLAGIAGKYPCYYVTGNHEYRAGKPRYDKQMAILRKYGITILSNEAVTLDVNGETIRICGVNDPAVYMVEQDVEKDTKAFLHAREISEETFLAALASVSREAEGDVYSILLSHRPEFYEAYRDCSFDLVLCGHAHGGQWRIPLLLNGVYAPNQGTFPKYAGGRFDAENMTMIVSRGLARETTWVPRIFNRPELVVIDIR